jgi:hypothetical protein
MDEREAERLTQELFGVFVRRGMVLWAVATLVQLVTALPDIWAVQGIPASAFVRPLAFGTGGWHCVWVRSMRTGGSVPGEAGY